MDDIEPSAINLEGTQPFHDADIDSLSNERTLLAWVRTGFTLVATGGLVLHVSDFADAARDLVIGTSTIALGVLVWGLGYMRFRTGERAITGDDPTLPIATVRTVAVAVSLVAVGALAITILTPN